jgi:hypothetical protein
VSETKIDSMFKDSLFEVDGYKLQRRDRTDSGGGIATFMRTDIHLYQQNEDSISNVRH